MASKSVAGGIKVYYRQKKAGSAISKASTSSSPSASKKSNNRGGVNLGAPSPQPPALVTSSSGAPDLKVEFDENEEILRQFDLDMSFGPCLGMSRLERWERGDRLGLNPPDNVASLLKGGSISLDCLLEGRV